MAVALLERHTISEGDVRRLSIRYSGSLDSGEKLTGTPELIHAGGDLAFSGQQLNAVPLTIRGKPTPVAEAASFTVQGQLAANAPYRFTVRVATTLGQTLNADVILDVV